MTTANLVPCLDCGHMLSRLAETCPSCARPLRPSAPREGLFLRTMNQLLALGFWGPIVLLAIAVAGGLVGLLVSRLE